MHLSVDATVAHQDLEGSLVTPGVVPGVDTEPVVLTVLGTPADGLDSVTTEGSAGLMRVDTGLVGQEIFVDGEGGCNGTVLLDLSLDVLNTSDTVGGIREVLVISIDAVGIIWAGLGALGLNLDDIVAAAEGRGSDVMGALGHGVVEAGASGAVVTSSDDTLVLEPVPWGTDLTTIAAEGEALNTIAAGSGVRDGEEGGEVATGGDANTIVEGLGGAVSPAGTAVGLVANVVDHGLALGPVSSSIKALGEVVSEDHGGVASAASDGPIGVDNGSHKALDFLEGGAIELGVDTGNPVGFGVVVDGLDVSGKVEGLLFSKQVHDVVIRAELDVLARGEGLGKVDKLGSVGEEVDAFLELGELLVDGVKLGVVAVGGVFDDGLAELADEVVLGEELVNAGGVGDSSDSGESE